MAFRSEAKWDEMEMSRFKLLSPVHFLILTVENGICLLQELGSAHETFHVWLISFLYEAVNVDFVPFIRGVRVLCNILSRINGPIEKHTHFRDGTCTQSGKLTVLPLGSTLRQLQTYFQSVFVWSRERRFCTIYTGCSRLKYIFSRIKGPLEKHTHFRDGMCTQSGKLTVLPLGSALRQLQTYFQFRFCMMFTQSSLIQTEN